MNEIREIRREKIREVRKAEKEYLKEIKKEENKELYELAEILEVIKSAIESLIDFKKSNIAGFQKQIRIYPVKNEKTHQLEAYAEIAAHQIHQLENLKGDVKATWNRLKSGPLSVDVYEAYKKELAEALSLLKQSRVDFKHIGGVYSRIAWVHNSIPGAILVEQNLKNRKINQMEHQTRM